MTPTETTDLRLALPKGRMQAGVERLFADAGIEIRAGARGYRPTLSLPGVEAKLLKPQNVVEMLTAGSRDIGLAGADWVRETGSEVVELLDTGLDPVRIVAAAPTDLLVGDDLPRRSLVVASEYARMTADWIDARELDAEFLRTYGATEVFPPEDADVIVDNTSTGADPGRQRARDRRRACCAPPRACTPTRPPSTNPALRERIDALVLMLRSVLEARGRG